MTPATTAAVRRVTMMELTPAEERAEWTIRAFMAEHGYSPTIRKIATALGFTSINPAQQPVQGLIRKGKITRGRTARSIQFIDQPERTKLLATLSALPIGTLRRLVASIKGETTDASSGDHD